MRGARRQRRLFGTALSIRKPGSPLTAPDTDEYIDDKQVAGGERSA
jgi:hypothetical protein